MLLSKPLFQSRVEVVLPPNGVEFVLSSMEAYCHALLFLIAVLTHNNKTQRPDPFSDALSIYAFLITHQKMWVLK